VLFCVHTVYSQIKKKQCSLGAHSNEAAQRTRNTLKVQSKLKALLVYSNYVDSKSAQ
jgi:hypothetical protein